MALHRWLTARAAGTEVAPRRRLAVLARALATAAANGTVTSPPLYRVLFFGTDDVSLATLRCLHANSLESDPAKRLVREIAVVCPSDRKVGGGRGRADGFSPVPVKKFALKHGLEVIQTPPQVKSLKQWRPEALAAPGRFDVGVVVSFGYFLHRHLLEHLPLGAINMHPSLLPKYRGPAPIHHALLNGDDATGISVIEIDPRAFDVGRVLLQERVAIPRGTTWAPLAKQLAEEGGRCVVETLRDLEQRKRSATVQDDALASHAPKLKLQDGFLELTETADAIYHRWQALSDSVGVTVRFKDKDVKLVELRRPTEEELTAVREEEARVSASLDLAAFAPGAFFFDKSLQALWLKCAPASNDTADRAWLLVTKLQQADRKVGAAIDFANGYRLKRALQQFERVAEADADAP